MTNKKTYTINYKYMEWKKRKDGRDIGSVTMLPAFHPSNNITTIKEGGFYKSF
ncbi:MAG: hypothetical protein HQ521_11630 [Bacteroidetes bacterium]|nr:hypothetical protein [Bacteroidota bacterium]